MWDAATGDAILLPFKHGDDVNTVVMSPDRRHIVTASYDQNVRIWPIPTEVRPVDEILSLAGLLSGSRVDETGGLVQLSPDELAAAWTHVRRKYPESVSCAAEDVLAWHEHEAALCEGRKNWAGAHMHLSRLVSERSEAADFSFRRANVRAELGLWSEAADDYARGTTLSSARPITWYYRALAQLAQDDFPGYRRTLSQMFSRFAGTNDAETKNLLAWTWALIDNSQGLESQALEAVRQALALKPRHPLYFNTLGSVLYRLGDDVEAIRTIEAGIEARDGVGIYSEWLFLAMAYQRLGQTETARAHLKKADDWWADEFRSHPTDSVPVSPNGWRDRLLYKLLRQEALAILDPT